MSATSGAPTPAAIAQLRNQIAADPADAVALCRLGELLWQMGQHEEAIGLWERSVKVDRTNPAVWQHLANAYLQAFNDIPAAKGAFTRALNAGLNAGDPVTAAAIFFERDALWKKSAESPENRLDEFEKYVEILVHHDALAVEFADLLTYFKHREEAIAFLKNRDWLASPVQPLAARQWARAHAALGREALWAKRFNDAHAFLNAGLAGHEKLRPAGPDIVLTYWLATLHRAQGDEAAAVLLFERAASADPGYFPEQAYYSALSLAELGRVGESRERFEAMERVAHSNPAPPDAILWDALAKSSLGEKKAARRLLNDHLLINPNDTLAADLLQTVDWGM